MSLKDTEVRVNPTEERNEKASGHRGAEGFLHDPFGAYRISYAHII